MDGDAIAPFDAWGHDVLWWLDKMVRTRRPLAERMTLVWHDWFATSNEGVGSRRLMIRQNNLFRKNALGNFRTLLRSVTKDPAMILWLSSADNTKWEPNENYARELMELFTLGAQPRLHGGRRPRAGPCPHGLSVRLDGHGARTSASTRRGTTPGPRRSSARVGLRLGGRLRPVPRACAAPVVLRPEALELLHPDAPE